MVTFAFRPVVAFQPNSPSCGNQPANISQTARRLDTPTKDKDATRKRTGPVSPHPAGRPAHPCPLDKPADISVTSRDSHVHAAVDAPDLTSDVGGGVLGEEGDDSGNFLGGAETPERDLELDL